MSATVEAMKRRPGMTKGAPNPGAFKKGHDVRRLKGGPARKSLLEQVSTAAAEHSQGVIDFLAQVYADPEQQIKMRIMAAQELLSRGVGTPVNMQVHKTIVDGAGGQVAGEGDDLQMIGSSPPKALTESQLENYVATMAQRALGVGPGKPIDGDYTEVENDD